MKKAVLAVMVVLMAAGAVWAKDFEVTKKAGDFSVTVIIDKNPPVTGDNNVAVVLKDAAGKTVADAQVSLEYSMPGMPGMPPMNYKANLSGQGGAYKGKVNFSMSSPWNLTVRIKKGDKTAQARFTVDVR